VQTGWSQAGVACTGTQGRCRHATWAPPILVWCSWRWILAQHLHSFSMAHMGDQLYPI
jgi:hypothetical protein